MQVLFVCFTKLYPALKSLFLYNFVLVFVFCFCIIPVEMKILPNKVTSFLEVHISQKTSWA